MNYRDESPDDDFTDDLLLLATALETCVSVIGRNPEVAACVEEQLAHAEALAVILRAQVEVDGSAPDAYLYGIEAFPILVEAVRVAQDDPRRPVRVRPEERMHIDVARASAGGAMAARLIRRSLSGE